MTSLRKSCHECGMPLAVGIANCSSCGAQVGTVFSETDFVPVDKSVPRRKKVNPEIVQYEKLETAKDRANTALILSLFCFLPFASAGLNGFIPFLGAPMAVAAIVYGVLGASVLSRNDIEEGRSSAIAGIVIGVIGVIAQLGYLLFFLKIANWNPLS